MSIDDDTWREHIEADKVQDIKIHALHVAVFGCQERPETVKAAIVPTMARINTWLDVLATMGRVTLGVLVGGGALVSIIISIVNLK